MGHGVEQEVVGVGGGLGRRESRLRGQGGQLPVSWQWAPDRTGPRPCGPQTQRGPWLAGSGGSAGPGSEGRLLLVVLVQGSLLPLQGGLLGRSGLGL